MKMTTMRALTGGAVLFATLCGAPLFAQAATLTVDCDAGGAIMSALAKAQAGDTVQVSGTCNEHVNIAPEFVRITLDGQKKTTLRHPGGKQASPHALYNRGKEITIRGFTVTGGLDGIHLSGPASAVIDGNVVVKNSGRGIHIDKGSIARMLNNTIEESGGVGISVTGTSYAYIGVFIPRIPALSPNIIRNNGGPGINLERGSGAWIVGNTISGNGGDAIAVSYNGGVNLSSETRKDGPNQTAAGQNNGGVAIRCAVGGFVDGPMGTLSGAQGAKAIDSGCVDRVTTR